MGHAVLSSYRMPTQLPILHIMCHTETDFPHFLRVPKLLGGLALELITNAQWFFGDRLQPWYPTHGFEMVAMQAVIAVSAITGLGLTFSNRKGAERTVFAAYGVQVL